MHTPYELQLQAIKKNKPCHSGDPIRLCCYRCTKSKGYTHSYSYAHQKRSLLLEEVDDTDANTVDAVVTVTSGLAMQALTGKHGQSVIAREEVAQCDRLA